MITKPRATVQDLYNVPEHGKAELVNGELIRMCPTGFKPGRAGGKIFACLTRYKEEHGGGYAIPDNVGFLVDLPNRESFSPDTAWYCGPEGTMRFVHGAPVFAVEVRSESDYGPVAERAITDKIADYFAAGTKVVWNVDLQDSAVIRVYRLGNPKAPSITFSRSKVANAEPAVPGWQFVVDSLFK
jgi:Uma2 family endonuclease